MSQRKIPVWRIEDDLSVIEVDTGEVLYEAESPEDLAQYIMNEGEPDYAKDIIDKRHDFISIVDLSFMQEQDLVRALQSLHVSQNQPEMTM